MSIVFSATSQDLKESAGFYYRDGVKYTGRYLSYYENGQKKIEMNLKEGKKHGKIRIYFDNGNLHELQSYRNNLMSGKWEMYNLEKAKLSVAHYKRGRKHGKWKIWDDNGNLLYKLQYNRGQKTGKWKKYNSEGTIINVRDY